MNDYTELKQDLHDLSDFLIALGDKKRQAIIIRLLEEVNCDGLQVTSLLEATHLSRPAISHHLKILKDAKIVNFRQEGKKNFYYLDHEQTEIKKLQAFLEKVIRIMNERNESPVTNYEVQNIRTQVAAESKVILRAAENNRPAITVALAYATELSDAQAKENHLAYSLDDGKTWKDYTEAFSVDQSLVLLVKSYDDAGNESPILKETIVVEKQEQNTANDTSTSNSSTDKTTEQSLSESTSGSNSVKPEPSQPNNQQNLALGTKQPSKAPAHNLPKSGTKSSTPFIMVGLILLVMALVLLFRKNRKH